MIDIAIEKEKGIDKAKDISIDKAIYKAIDKTIDIAKTRGKIMFFLIF